MDYQVSMKFQNVKHVIQIYFVKRKATCNLAPPVKVKGEPLEMKWETQIIAEFIRLRDQHVLVVVDEDTLVAAELFEDIVTVVLLNDQRYHCILNYTISYCYELYLSTI